MKRISLFRYFIHGERNHNKIYIVIVGYPRDPKSVNHLMPSPILLVELGLNVRVLCEGDGISRRETNDNSPFSGDVIRKVLDGMDLIDLIKTR